MNRLTLLSRFLLKAGVSYRFSLLHIFKCVNLAVNTEKHSKSGDNWCEISTRWVQVRKLPSFQERSGLESKFTFRSAEYREKKKAEQLIIRTKPVIR